MPANSNNITNAYEFIIVFGDDALKSNTTYTKNIIHTAVNSKMPQIHKAVMNSEVSDWFVKTFTKEDDVILDPFAGLGTTALSCKAFNRRYIGFELIKEYSDYANNLLNI